VYDQIERHLTSVDDGSRDDKMKLTEKIQSFLAVFPFGVRFNDGTINELVMTEWLDALAKYPFWAVEMALNYLRDNRGDKKQPMIADAVAEVKKYLKPYQLQMSKISSAYGEALFFETQADYEAHLAEVAEKERIAEEKRILELETAKWMAKKRWLWEGIRKEHQTRIGAGIAAEGRLSERERMAQTLAKLEDGTKLRILKTVFQQFCALSDGLFPLDTDLVAYLNETTDDLLTPEMVSLREMMKKHLNGVTGGN